MFAVIESSSRILDSRIPGVSAGLPFKDISVPGLDPRVVIRSGIAFPRTCTRWTTAPT